MTSTVHEVYALILGASGKLKIRAKRLRADDGVDAVFNASVLLHEAARVQRRATDALSECPPATRLASAVEECWCLAEGLDPPSAAKAWGEVLRARENVDAPTADGISSRLAPRYHALNDAFVTAIQASPTLLAVREASTLRNLSTSVRQ